MSEPQPLAPPIDRLVFDPTARRRALLETIAAASRTLRLSIFRCDDETFANALVDARARGVGVRVLMTRHATGARVDLERLTRRLVAAGLDVVRYAGPFSRYHAKYLVADERVALVATSNYTARSFSTTCDFLVESRDPAVVATLGRLFDHDATTPSLPFTHDARLVVGPEQTETSLLAMMRSATRSLRVLDHKLSDRRARAILDERQRRGVSVEVLAAKMLGSQRAHGKLLLVDDRQAVVGSIALSRRALDRRRELAIVISTPVLVEALSDLFDWLATSGQRPHREAAARS